MKQTTKRRTIIGIYMDILDALLFNRLSLKFTRLMQKANLNHRRLSHKVLPDMMRRGLVIKRIKNNGTYYTITNEGINNYIEYRIWASFNQWDSFNKTYKEGKQ